MWLQYFTNLQFICLVAVFFNSVIEEFLLNIIDKITKSSEVDVHTFKNQTGKRNLYEV